MPEQRYLFVINPISGSSEPDWIVEQLEQSPLPYPIEIIWTTNTTDLATIEAVVEQGPYKCLVAVGGDGTFSLVAKVALRHELVVGLIPSGSSNGMAKELGISQDIQEAILTLLHRQERVIDGGSINGELFFHIADTGLNAAMIDLYRQGTFRTNTAYAWHLLRAYLTFDPIQAIVLAEGGETLYTGDVLMIAVCNGKAFGTRVLLNPDGIMDDGLLEIVIVLPFPKWLGPDLLLDLMAGDVSSPYLVHAIGSKFTLQFTSPPPLQVDGEYMPSQKQLDVQVLPAALRVMVPRLV